MNAAELRAKINADHARLRELTAQITPGAQRQFGPLIVQAKADITRLEIQLAAMSGESTCPHCGEAKPDHFLVCEACWREVPWELWRAHKGTAHHAHARAANTGRPDAGLEAAAKQAATAVLAHLKQFSSAIP